MMLLVPADVLRPRRADEHFASEANAAREAGWEVALVDHDALAAGAPGGADPAVARVPEGEATAVYRGWMLRSERYAAFARVLARRGVTLRTGAAQYRQAHELPGWYEALRPVTPRSAWTLGTGRDAFDAARAELGPGPAVLRDHVKSMKHYWDEAAFIRDLADADAAWAVARRFAELRDDELAGGFVLRRYEAFAGAEVRTWWVDGACRLSGPHPDTPGDPAPADVDLTPVAPLVAGLGLAFATVDLARREDGAWRVVELGDGQVSDRPSTIPPGDLIAALTSQG
jgi:hypothetical protein